jgi:hypothetical protein
MVRCHNCGAPRRAENISCPYCSAAFTAANPPPSSSSAGPQAWDAEFVKMRRQPRTEALLQERTGLPPARRTTPLLALMPLLVFSAISAYIVYRDRGEDGALDRGSLVIAGIFVAMGAAAAITAFRRSARLARTPIEGRLVRVGVRDITQPVPQKGDERQAIMGQGKARWVLALEDGTERYVWPVRDARGRDRLTRGAHGVAWLQGPHLLGFEPL